MLRGPLRIVSLSTVFPNEDEPLLGTFVNNRLQALAEFVEPPVVIAPVAAVDYSHPRGKLLANWKLPFERTEGKLRVFHPRWFYPPRGGSWNSAFLAFAIRRLVARLHAEHRISLLDAHFGFPMGIAASRLARKLGLPYMVTLRGNETLHARNPRIRKRMVAALQQADRVICVSESLLRFAQSMGVRPERLRTIPNGINTAVFHPRDRAACRARHQIPPTARVVLSAGALIERKGHHRVISALANMPAGFDDAFLVIAGGPVREGRFDGTIQRMVEEKGLGRRVRMAGRVSPDTLAELMCAADVFCLASTREGWPNVIHEAMGCGTPVVSTDVGGVPDMVPSETLGMVVPAGDEPALQRALESALDQEWDPARIAQWAAARSWPQVAREVLEEIRSVVGAHDSPAIPVT